MMRIAALGSLACLAMAGCGDAPEPANVAAAPPPAQVGEASFYGVQDEGEKTASGARFDPDALTAASRTLPLGAKAKVTNLETGEAVAVTINDRGPYAGGRIIDVSPKAADALGLKHKGVADVAVQPLAKR